MNISKIVVALHFDLFFLTAEHINLNSLELLLDYCDTEFPARRVPEDGYRYYRSSTEQWIDVSGPKLSKSD